MAEATDQQMQVFCDTRLRVFAEQIRAAYLAAKDHKASLDDEYARAVGASRWNDARTDGPPHLLQAGNNASPDDLLNFNSFLAAFIAFVEANGQWATLMRACVRAPGA